MPRMSGIDALMAVLDSHDVDYVFGNPGSTEVVFMDALYQHPKIKYIMALHETVATGMAGGYSWASGKTGVINVHTAPGVANLVSALYNAYVSDFNLVVTAGQQDTRLIQREPGLTGDLVAMTRPWWT
ncbi:MAG: thiamine pyrophosphate-binding protein [Chloroflexi bacterium]|nr:thiamine pyrophosphate-binding protein [Chloroflexota bacterium]